MAANNYRPIHQCVHVQLRFGVISVQTIDDGFRARSVSRSKRIVRTYVDVFRRSKESSNACIHEFGQPKERQAQEGMHALWFHCPDIDLEIASYSSTFSIIENYLHGRDELA